MLVFIPSLFNSSGSPIPERFNIFGLFIEPAERMISASHMAVWRFPLIE